MELWSENSKECEVDCQCSGLIMEGFKINSGNNATKRRREEAITNNFKIKMSPHSLDFNIKQSPLKSPIATTSKRRILGDIQNSPNFRPKNSPLKSPLVEQTSPLTSRSEQTFIKRSSTKISRIFEERSKFKMSNKENEKVFISETFVKFDVEEETRDTEFGVTVKSSVSERKVSNWSVSKLNFTNALQTRTLNSVKEEVFVPEKEMETEIEGDETLHDLEEEFDADNFDQCTKYEIISTDSPNIISRGRTSSSRKITSRNFVFGAPLAENEPSTSFNRPNGNATRMLNFEDEIFEFPSPAIKRSSSNLAKKSLKFTETPTKVRLRHDKSDSSIGSMPSPASSKLRIYPSESSTSMESGFVSEFEDPFLDIEESSRSPKVRDFNELITAQIKGESPKEEFSLHRPTLQRSLSLNQENSKARMSLFAILESPTKEKKCNKRSETCVVEGVCNKRRKSNCENPGLEKVQRPVLQRAFSENHASIMSALARSVVDPDLIGDFTLPFALPLTSGDHSDLKSISCDTLAGLLRGEYEHCISDFQVIDCRYPYEYEGGHILGAVNLYTPDQILTLVNKPLQPREKETESTENVEKRSILVFHCEFSLERGPKLSRFLRSSDRAKNTENYPCLHYPEIYLLHEGYRAFYQRYRDLCSPVGYTAMMDPKHRHLLRQHRSVQSSSSSSSSTSHHRRQRLLL